MPIDTPSNPILYVNGISADPWVNFNPGLEYGFPLTNFGKYERTNDYENLSYLSLQDVSSLFHNFYGLRLTMKVDDRETSGKARFPTTMNYQTMSNPRSRYNNGQVNQVNFRPTESDIYLGGDASLYSTTNQMYRFFSQPNGKGNFLGFGVFLFSGNLRGRTSRYGGTIYHYFQLASWALPKRFIPQSSVTVENPEFDPDDPENDEPPQIKVSYFDGEYQRYLNSLNYPDERLVPNIEASYNVSEFVLNDYNGNRIQLKLTEAIMKKTDYYPTFKEDEEGETYIEKVDAIKPPRTTFILTEGLFYKYGGNFGNLEPNNYLM